MMIPTKVWFFTFANETTPSLSCLVQPNKVVILLTGRYAGKKAVIVKNNDDGTSGRPYGHAIVAGLAKEPRKVCSTSSEAKLVFNVAALGSYLNSWHAKCRSSSGHQ